mgnify:CR=1 FL=1
MKNIFESIYQEVQKIHADYDAAKDAGSEEGKNAARADYEKLCERINEKGASFIRIARAYQENGCTLEELIRINGDRKGFGEEGYELAPAYLFKVN